MFDCPRCNKPVDLPEWMDPAKQLMCQDCLNREPQPGSLAFSARMFVEMGVMTGEEADAWKDRMKDGLDE